MPSKKKKFNARFPPARIKKIMQTDEDVGKVAAAVPVIISRALELFIESLIVKASETTRAKQAKTLSSSHIKHTIQSDKQFDFLKDLVASIPDVAITEEEGAEASSSFAPHDPQSSSMLHPTTPMQPQTPRPRGRPRKKTVDGEEKVPKKRGRKPKAAAAATSLTAEPAAAEQHESSESSEEEEDELTHDPALRTLPMLPEQPPVQEQPPIQPPASAELASAVLPPLPQNSVLPHPMNFTQHTTEAAPFNPAFYSPAPSVNVMDSYQNAEVLDLSKSATPVDSVNSVPPPSGPMYAMPSAPPVDSVNSAPPPSGPMYAMPPFTGRLPPFPSMPQMAVPGFSHMGLPPVLTRPPISMTPSSSKAPAGKPSEQLLPQHTQRFPQHNHHS